MKGHKEEGVQPGPSCTLGSAQWRQWALEIYSGKLNKAKMTPCVEPFVPISCFYCFYFWMYLRIDVCSMLPYHFISDHCPDGEATNRDVSLTKFSCHFSPGSELRFSSSASQCVGHFGNWRQSRTPKIMIIFLLKHLGKGRNNQREAVSTWRYLFGILDLGFWNG